MADVIVHVGLQPSEYKSLTLGELAAIRAAHNRRHRN